MEAISCPHCGQSHPANALYCPATGLTLPGATRSSPAVCPNCGASIPSGAQFCPICGRAASSYASQIGAQPVMQRPLRRFYIRLGVFTFILFALGSWILVLFNNGWSGVQIPTAINPEGGIATSTGTGSNAGPAIATFVGTNTAAFSAPTFTQTTEAVVTPIDLKVNSKDGAEMVFVPSGEFAMGRDPDPDPNKFWGAEAPMHLVYLDSFHIYRTEVTNAMYQSCVAANACPRPDAGNSRTRENYYENPEYSNYPVILVSWLDAVSYCQWAGARLPTEAEWEKAARGVDGRYFPWGNDSLSGDLANFCDRNCPASEKEIDLDDGYPDTAPVGTYSAGASPYSALDMAGNVWEWVSDFFDPGYYRVSPYENPLGPDAGQSRVIRGGSWFNPASGIRTVARASQKPGSPLDTIGFRCAVDASE